MNKIVHTLYARIKIYQNRCVRFAIKMKSLFCHQSQTISKSVSLVSSLDCCLDAKRFLMNSSANRPLMGWFEHFTPNIVLKFLLLLTFVAAKVQQKNDICKFSSKKVMIFLHFCGNLNTSKIAKDIEKAWRSFVPHASLGLRNARYQNEKTTEIHAEYEYICLTPMRKDMGTHTPWTFLDCLFGSLKVAKFQEARKQRQ